MKKIYTIITILALASCAKQEAPGTLHTLDVDCGGKVQLAEGLSVWNSGDRVTVFYKSDINTGWTYSGTDKSASGKLATEETLTGTGSDIIALYPYNADATLANGVIRTTLPSTQKFEKGSFGKDAAVMAAKTTGTSLSFKYAVGIVKLSLSGSSAVKEIILEGGNGEVLSGAATIDVNGERPLLAMDASATGKQITLGGCTTCEDGSFYFCVPAGKYEKGFIYTVNYNDGTSQKVQDTREVTLSAGQMISSEAAKNGSLTLTVKFRTASGTKNTPFTASPQNSMCGSKTSAFWLKTDSAKKYPFYFYVAARDDGKQRLNINTGGALQIGASDHDYILLPAVEGKTLREVTVCTASSTKSVDISTDEDTPQIIAGGETQTSPSGSDDYPMTFSLTGSEPGKSYRIELYGVTMIRYFELYYAE